MFEYLHYSEKRCKPHFVIIIDNAFFKFGNRYRIPIFFYDSASHWNLDSQELVAFTILTGPGFEKTRESSHLGRVCMKLHLRQ